MGRFWRRGKKEEKPTDAAGKTADAGNSADAAETTEKREETQGDAQPDQNADPNNVHQNDLDDGRAPDQQGSQRQRTQEETQAEEELAEELRHSRRFPRDEELHEDDRGVAQIRGRQARGNDQDGAGEAEVEQIDDEDMVDEEGGSDAEDGSFVRDDRPPKEKFLEGLLVDPCEMLRSMGSMAPTAHPSILQCLEPSMVSSYTPSQNLDKLNACRYPYLQLHSYQMPSAFTRGALTRFGVSHVCRHRHLLMPSCEMHFPSLYLLSPDSENCMSAAIRPQLVSSGIAFRDLVYDPAPQQFLMKPIPASPQAMHLTFSSPFSCGILLGEFENHPQHRAVLLPMHEPHAAISIIERKGFLIEVKSRMRMGCIMPFAFKRTPRCSQALSCEPDMAPRPLITRGSTHPPLSETCAEDAKLFSRPTRWKARQVDEVTVAWGSIPFPSVGKDMQIPRRAQVLQVPLFGGSRLKPVQLAQVVGQGGGWLKCGCGTSGKGATLNIALGRLSAQEVRDTSTLPATIVTSWQVVPFLAMYRRLLAFHMLQHAGALMAPHLSAVLVIFPRVVDDPQMLFNFFRLWKGRMDALTPKEKLDDKVQLREFAQVLTTLWPLMNMHDYPNEQVLWDANYSSAHASIAEKYIGTTPYNNLSLNTNNWLHKPFRVNELTYNYGDYTGPSV
eukprot:jgi/Mesvir1/29453/Mv23029-RA.1